MEFLLNLVAGFIVYVLPFFVLNRICDCNTKDMAAGKPVANPLVTAFKYALARSVVVGGICTLSIASRFPLAILFTLVMGMLPLQLLLSQFLEFFGVQGGFQYNAPIWVVFLLNGFCILVMDFMIALVAMASFEKHKKP